jgi:hypothetical protein
MSFIINPPPRKVVQFQLGDNCWAAALESWLDVVKVKCQPCTQRDLIKQQGTLGMDIQPFIDQAEKNWEMETRVRLDFPSATEMAGTLHQLGYLYLAHRLREIAWWHCVVLYGVTSPSDDEPKYHFMDPADGNLAAKPKAFFLQGDSPRMLVGWHKPRSVRRG